MKNLILIILMLSSYMFANSEYILVDEYYQNNPSLKANSDKFVTTVSKVGKPIDFKQKKKIKIYMIYPGKQVSDYWRRSKSSFEARLKEIGIEYTLIDYFTKNHEIDKQAKALFEALQDESDYLIFTLDAKKHLKFINTIINRQSPKLILQNITTPLKSLVHNQPFLYVGFDHTIGAKMIADEYLKITKKDSKYAVLYGSKGYVSQMRGDEFIKYVRQNSNLKMIDSYYTDFNKQKAKLATLDIIKNHKDVSFIYACSTDIALGAIEAIKQSGLLGKIKVNGWGGGSSELKAITDGEMDFTVMRINDDNGVAMAEAIKLDINSKTKSVPLIYSGEFQIVKKGILKKNLNKLKKAAFRYSGE